MQKDIAARRGRSAVVLRRRARGLTHAFAPDTVRHCGHHQPPRLMLNIRRLNRCPSSHPHSIGRLSSRYRVDWQRNPCSAAIACTSAMLVPRPRQRGHHPPSSMCAPAGLPLVALGAAKPHLLAQNAVPRRQARPAAGRRDLLHLLQLVRPAQPALRAPPAEEHPLRVRREAMVVPTLELELDREPEVLERQTATAVRAGELSQRRKPSGGVVARRSGRKGGHGCRRV